jgi:hypothetical protein
MTTTILPRSDGLTNGSFRSRSRAGKEAGGERDRANRSLRHAQPGRAESRVPGIIDRPGSTRGDTRRCRAVLLKLTADVKPKPWPD